MNILDIIILVVLCLFALKGFVRGLVNEVSSLASLFLGAWLAYRFYPSLAAPIEKSTHLPSSISGFVAFILILFAVGIIAHILGNIITSALKLVLLNSINRLGGLIVGVTEGVLLLSLLLCTATADFMPNKLKLKIQTTESANMLAQTGDRLLERWRGRSESQQ